LRGARQVGKSTLVRLFAEQQQLELIELNFERNAEYAELFAAHDPKQTIASIRLMLNSEISRDATTPQIVRSLDQLEMARAIHKVCRTSANGIPLAAEENRKFFKLLFIDTGLVSTMFNVSWQVLQEDVMLVHQGAMAEQWVGQELLGRLDSHQSPGACILGKRNPIQFG